MRTHTTLREGHTDTHLREDMLDLHGHMLHLYTLGLTYITHILHLHTVASTYTALAHTCVDIYDIYIQLCGPILKLNTLVRTDSALAWTYTHLRRHILDLHTLAWTYTILTDSCINIYYTWRHLWGHILELDGDILHLYTLAWTYTTLARTDTVLIQSCIDIY